MGRNGVVIAEEKQRQCCSFEPPRLKVDSARSDKENKELREKMTRLDSAATRKRKAMHVGLSAGSTDRVNDQLSAGVGGALVSADGRSVSLPYDAVIGGIYNRPNRRIVLVWPAVTDAHDRNTIVADGIVHALEHSVGTPVLVL